MILNFCHFFYLIVSYYYNRRRRDVATDFIGAEREKNFATGPKILLLIPGLAVKL